LKETTGMVEPKKSMLRRVFGGRWSILLIVMAALYGFLRGLDRQRPGIRDQNDLDLVATEMNKTLPKNIDATTQLTHVQALPGVLVYEYTFLQDVSGLKTSAFAANLKTTSVRDNCANQELRDRYLKRGISLRHSFSDRQGMRIASIDVAPADCGP
jgi:hypothetical protein